MKPTIGKRATFTETAAKNKITSLTGKAGKNKRRITMKKIIAITLALMLILASAALAEAVAFNDPAAVRPETIEYPVQGLSWNATTDVRANEEYTIAMIVKNNTNPFMNGVLNGFAKAGEDIGFEALLLSPQTADSNEDQVRLVEDMIQRGVDAICIHPVDSNGIVPALEKAWEAGIPVLVQGTRANTDKIYGWYGTKYADEATLIAEYLAEKLDYKGNVIYITGPQTAQNAIDEMEATHAVFDKYPELNIIEEQPGNFNRATSMSVMENLTQKYSEDDIDWVIGGNDECAMGAIAAMENASWKLGFEDGGIGVSGIDCNKDASYAIQEGTLTVSINPDPVSLGYVGAAFLVKYLNDGDLFPEYVAWPDFQNATDVMNDATTIDDYIENVAWWKDPA